LHSFRSVASSLLLNSIFLTRFMLFFIWWWRTVKDALDTIYYILLLLTSPHINIWKHLLCVDSICHCYCCHGNGKVEDYSILERGAV
jgi:hypothetical protein